MHSTLHLHIELYVCMYFIACLYELLMLIYMNCNIVYFVNEFGKDKCNIFLQANKSILVLCSDTVKKNLFPVILGCKNKPFYYTGMLLYYSSTCSTNF